jgi:hypothetical protein
MLPRLSGLALLLVLLAGCKNHDPIRQNMIDVRPSPIEREQAPALDHPVTIEVVDARPDWERRPFDGTCSLIPLERLDPAPEQLLKAELQSSAGDLPDLPSAVRLEIQSFRVVNSTEDPFIHETHSCRSPITPIFPDGIGGGGPWMAAVAVACLGILGTAVVGIWTYDQATELIHAYRHAHGRPPEMGESYARGVTCDLRAVVVSDWPNGEHREIALREVINHAPQASERTPAYTTADAVRDAVNGVCRQLACDWHERILNPASSAGSGVVVPVYTAYSGN